MHCLMLCILNEILCFGTLKVFHELKHSRFFVCGPIQGAKVLCVCKLWGPASACWWCMRGRLSSGGRMWSPLPKWRCNTLFTLRTKEPCFYFCFSISLNIRRSNLCMHAQRYRKKHFFVNQIVVAAVHKG